MPDRSSAAKVADGVTSVILLCLLGAMSAVLFFLAAFVAAGADACADPGIRCSEAGITVAVVAVRWVPVVVLVLAVLVACVRAARRRTAFWAPLIGVVVIVLVALGSVLLATVSVGATP